MKKRIYIILCFIMLILVSCVEKNPRRNYSNFNPLTAAPEFDGLDFLSLHNDVLTAIMSEKTPFFYIKQDSFDISGSNDPKVIVVKAVCLNGTVVEEADLFLSMVLNFIGYVAAEQDGKYLPPTMDNSNTYIDFGTVFTEYDLDLDITDDNGKVLVKKHIKAGDKIPIEPGYWKE